VRTRIGLAAENMISPEERLFLSQRVSRRPIFPFDQRTLARRMHCIVHRSVAVTKASDHVAVVRHGPGVSWRESAHESRIVCRTVFSRMRRGRSPFAHPHRFDAVCFAHRRVSFDRVARLKKTARDFSLGKDVIVLDRSNHRRQESFGRPFASLFFGWMLAIVAVVAAVSGL
jgi:hypothetical protein